MYLALKGSLMPRLLYLQGYEHGKTCTLYKLSHYILMSLLINVKIICAHAFYFYSVKRSVLLY